MRSRIPFSRSFWTGLILTSLTLLAVPGTVGATAVSQTYTPAGGGFTITGHGWGHGHGMSQYGARGAARAGLSAAQILAFYYPGTALAPYTSPIRVRITADGGGVQIVAEGSQVVRASNGSGAQTLPVDANIDRWRLVPSGAGNVLRYHRVAQNDWVDFASFGGDAEFASTSGVLRVVITGGAVRTYRGAVRAAAATAGSSARYTVNVLSIDDYVRGVVGSEMPTSWEAAAVQAQAVAARSYAAYEAKANASKSSDLCDTSACQVYSGVVAESAAGNAAVNATAGTIVTYKGAPAFTQFSSSSGGYSSPGSVPYLVGQADPYEAGGSNPYYTWSVPVTSASIQAKYPELGTLKSIKVTDREGGGEWGGYVNTIILDGSAKDVTVTGETFRSKFGLRSRYYTFGAATGAPVSTTGTARAVPTTTKAITATLKATAGTRLGKAKGSLVKKGSWSSLRFSNGVAYFHTSGKVFLLKGKLATKYIALGGSVSKLGSPTSTYTLTGGVYRATFTKGVLKYNTKSKRFTILRK